jgi:hypothetical protein
VFYVKQTIGSFQPYIRKIIPSPIMQYRILEPRPPGLDFSYQGISGFYSLVRILDQHLNVLIEPHASSWSSLKTALTVALAGGLNPHETVNVRVVRVRLLRGAQSGGRHVAPLAPFFSSARKVNTALINDETRRQV